MVQNSIPFQNKTECADHTLSIEIAVAKEIEKRKDRVWCCEIL